MKSVSKKTFYGLSHIENVELHSNSLSCITPGTFDSLRSLNHLTLHSNAFQCNCHMGWFADWLRSKHFISTSPNCSSPAQLQDRPIAQLSPQDFRCNGELRTCCP